jgi:hypothetical protein
VSDTPTPADGAALEAVRLMLGIADDLTRLGHLTQQPGIPPYLNLGPRLEEWADSLRTTADQAARFTPALQPIVDEHTTRG